MKMMIIMITVVMSLGKLWAQKSLAVDAFTFGHFRRFHVYQNEPMTYKLKGSTHRQTHMIVDMQDSLLYIESGESIRLDAIKTIVFDRSNFLTRMTATAFRIAGIGYIGLDAFNNAINSEKPIFKERVLVVGAILFVAGELIHIANKKRVRVGKHATLKVLDLSFN